MDLAYTNGLMAESTKDSGKMVSSMEKASSHQLQALKRKVFGRMDNVWAGQIID